MADNKGNEEQEKGFVVKDRRFTAKKQEEGFVVRKHLLLKLRSPVCSSR
jgi:hypothetical protein